MECAVNILYTEILHHRPSRNDCDKKRPPTLHSFACRTAEVPSNDVGTCFTFGKTNHKLWQTLHMPCLKSSAKPCPSFLILTLRIGTEWVSECHDGLASGDLGDWVNRLVTELLTAGELSVLSWFVSVYGWEKRNYFEYILFKLPNTLYI